MALGMCRDMVPPSFTFADSVAVATRLPATALPVSLANLIPTTPPAGPDGYSAPAPVRPLLREIGQLATAIRTRVEGKSQSSSSWTTTGEGVHQLMLTPHVGASTCPAARAASGGAPTPTETAVAKGRLSRPIRAAAITAVIGVLLTVVSAGAAHRADTATERRLLETQSKQAAAVLSTAIFVIEQPLTTALQVQATSGPGGDPSVFRRTFAANVGGEDALFVSASLWRRDGRAFTRLAAVGAPPGMNPAGQAIQDFLGRAAEVTTSVVQRVVVGNQGRIAFALADPATGFVIKVERAIPRDRRSRQDQNSAFAQIDYAIYLGEDTGLDDMTTTSVDPADLPLEGSTYETTIPFGDTVLTLVTRPTEHLGSPLSQRLPVILLSAVCS